MDNRYGFNIVNSSRRRPIVFAVDSTAITNKTDYTVIIPGGHRDVLSVELVKAVVPNPDEDNYLILKIFGMDEINGNTTPLNGAFCTIERDSAFADPLIYKRENSDHNISYTHYMNQPSKLGKLKISFQRPDGSAPDFGVNNHYLVFEINTLNQPPLPNL